jgi:hypothetical protein
MLPETGSDQAFKDAVINHLPIWEMSARLQHDGIVVHHFNYRPGWITLEISWHLAHETWGHATTTSFIKSLVEAYVHDQGFTFNHWVVREPVKPLWLDTTDQKAREAKVYIRTVTPRGICHAVESEIVENARLRSRRKVNANILATSFNVSEEEGRRDED